jgi:predicted metal-dependent phosphoesterase TrpH
MFLADFHVHSNFSDGRVPLPEVIDLYGKRGFGCIAITDHLCESQTVLGKASHYLGCSLTPATFPFYMEILRTEAARAWDQYRMVVLPGFELTKNSVSNHRSAHILGIGISDYVPADGDPLDLARAIRAQGALAVAAHPVWTRLVEKQTYHLWNRREELAEAFDAWEVASGCYIFDEVAASRLPKIASSDLHVPRQISSWKTVLDCERHPEAILDAIRKQRINFRYYEEVPRRDDYYPGPTAMGNRVRGHGDRNVALASAV